SSATTRSGTRWWSPVWSATSSRSSASSEPRRTRRTGASLQPRGYSAVVDARPSLAEIRKVPKVLLHDHLDGGLRPATVIDLAREHGYAGLPTTDEGELARWFTTGANRRDLDLYLETFVHTVGVMQHADALER